MKDSAVFDIDAYKNFFRRITGKMKRELEVKEFTMQEVEPQEALELLRVLQSSATELSKEYSSMKLPKKIYYLFRRFPLRDNAQGALNDAVDYLSNTRQKNVIRLVNTFPFQLTVRNVSDTLSATYSLINLFENEMVRATEADAHEAT